MNVIMQWLNPDQLASLAALGRAPCRVGRANQCSRKDQQEINLGAARFLVRIGAAVRVRYGPESRWEVMVFDTIEITEAGREYLRLNENGQTCDE